MPNLLQNADIQSYCGQFIYTNWWWRVRTVSVVRSPLHTQPLSVVSGLAGHTVSSANLNFLNKVHSLLLPYFPKKHLLGDSCPLLSKKTALSHRGCQKFWEDGLSILPTVLEAFCSFSTFLILRNYCQASRHASIFMWLQDNGKNAIPTRNMRVKVFWSQKL